MKKNISKQVAAKTKQKKQQQSVKGKPLSDDQVSKVSGGDFTFTKTTNPASGKIFN